MKIAFDVAQTCSARAGCGWVADLLARALAAAAPENELLLLHHFGTWLNPDTYSGTHIQLPNVKEPLAACSVAEARRLWTRVAEGKANLPGTPDVVHANCFQAPPVGSAKLVYTVHDVSFWVRPELTTEENRLVCQRGTLDALNRAAGFVFISEYSRQEFGRLFPGLCERRGTPAVVTPLASRFPTLTHPRTQFSNGAWLAVGSIEPRKNYDLLLDAMKLYGQRSKVRRPLTIAGGAGWKSEATRARIKQLNQQGLVRYEGYVDDARLCQLYRESFALLFASQYEGFGLPLIEAMSQGCPVISTRNTSLPEVGSEAVLWCEPADANELARQMCTLEDSPDLQAACSENGIARACGFSWRKTAEQVLELYGRVLR
jgi:glycosyltransferase involved in cell wall biosynthesis